MFPYLQNSFWAFKVYSTIHLEEKNVNMYEEEKVKSMKCSSVINSKAP